MTNESSGNSDSHERRVWVDKLCDRFEDAWGTPQQFSIESVLQELDAEKHAAALKSLLPLELELRAGSDRPATLQEFTQRFPEHRDLVAEVVKTPPPPDSLAGAQTVPPNATPSDDTNHSEAGGALKIPRQLGRYRIIRKLGQGAMGSVFLAHDGQLDREVALKIPRGDVQRNKELRARFQREAQAAAALHHPNICPIYDIGEFQDIHYICMGYIEGFSLSRFAVAESGLSEQRIAELVLKLAQALAVAHEAGFIHRDLKPANVMMNEHDEPVILDFGLARRIDPTQDTRVTQTGTTIGSPAYMSPEQVDGDQAKIGQHSDIYSLGVILYELLTGRIPFEGSMASVLGQIMTKEPDKPSDYRRDLSVRLENICLRMMAKDPEKRHPSMHAVVAALKEYLEKYSSAAATDDVEATSDESSVNVDQGARRRQQIEGLMKSGDYGQAEKLLVALSRETADNLLEAATWAADELPKLRKTREEVRAGRQEIYNTAVRLMKAHDYKQAVRLLEEYPFDMRTPKMQDLMEQAEGQLHEIERLRSEIRKARNRADNKELLSLLRQLLEIKPGDRKAKELHEQLTRRSAGPITRMLGKHTPSYIERFSAGLQTGLLLLIVLAATAYPAYQWSKGYLTPEVNTHGNEPHPGISDSEHNSLPTPDQESSAKLDYALRPAQASFPTISFSGSSAHTLEAWVLAQDLPQDGGTLAFLSMADFVSNEQDRGIYLSVERRAAKGWLWQAVFGTEENEHSRKIRSPSEVVRDSWTHVAATIDGRSVALFVDGRIVSESVLESGFVPSTESLVIGGVPFREFREEEIKYHYHGYPGLVVDEIRVSKSVRYIAEFTPEIRFEPDANTLALFHCDEGSGDQLIDASGNGHHGKIRNVEWVVVDDAVKLSDLAISTTADTLPAGETYTNDLGMTFVRVPEGPMPGDEATVVPSFYVQTTEVTQAQWANVMTEIPWASRPSLKEALGDNRPAMNMTPEAAVRFCRELTRLEQKSERIPDDWRYDLPSRIESEYAARAGSAGTFTFGDDPAEYSDYAWFRGNSRDAGIEFASDVGQKKPNAWGLFDVHGNVNEWCRDGHPNRTPTPPPNALYSHRGGSFISEVSPLANFVFTTNTQVASVGFRPVLFRINPNAIDVDAIQPQMTRVGLNFDGDDHIQIPDFRYTGNTPLTVETVVALSSYVEKAPHPGKILANNHDGGFFLAVPKGRLDFCVVGTENGKSEYTYSGYNRKPNDLDRPIHLAGVYDNAGKMYWYIDGKKAGMNRVPGKHKSSHRSVYIGTDPEHDNSPAKDGYFTGRVFMVRISSSVRYTEDFTVPTSFTPDDATECLYKMDEGSGDTVNDSSKHARHAKIVGATWIGGAATEKSVTTPKPAVKPAPPTGQAYGPLRIVPQTVWFTQAITKKKIFQQEPYRIPRAIFTASNQYDPVTFTPPTKDGAFLVAVNGSARNAGVGWGLAFTAPDGTVFVSVNLNGQLGIKQTLAGGAEKKLASATVPGFRRGQPNELGVLVDGNSLRVFVNQAEIGSRVTVKENFRRDWLGLSAFWGNGQGEIVYASLQVSSVVAK